MAYMEMKINGGWYNFRGVAEQFPFLTRRVLANIGVEGVKDLYEFIQDQGITYHWSTKNSLGIPLTGATVNHYRGNQHVKSRRAGVVYKHQTVGRRMVSFSIDRDGEYLQLKSFPLNIIRIGAGVPRKSKRFAGKMIMRIFEAGFVPVVKRIAQEKVEIVMRSLLASNEEEADFIIRGGFSRGERMFQGDERNGKTRFFG